MFRFRSNPNLIVLLYLSHPQCSVCQSLLPRVDEMISGYPEVEAWYVNTQKLPVAAGVFSVFTHPTLLLFTEGRESLRLVRNFGLSELRDRVERILDLIKPETGEEV